MLNKSQQSLAHAQDDSKILEPLVDSGEKIKEISEPKVEAEAVEENAEAGADEIKQSFELEPAVSSPPNIELAPQIDESMKREEVDPRAAYGLNDESGSHKEPVGILNKSGSTRNDEAQASGDPLNKS